MRATSRLLFVVGVILFGCSSKEPLPTQVWSQSCVQLAPYKDVYRLTGMCCSYLEFPKIDLKKDLTFSVEASLYVFNGAGYIGTPTVMSGYLSVDENTLTVNYLSESYALKPGYATASCYCICK